MQRVFTTILPLLFTLGFFVPSHDVFALLCLMLTTWLVLRLPIRDSIFVYVTYMLFDGMFKIFSNYNPIIHVFQDILLFALFVRSMLDARTGGPSKVWATPHWKLIAVLALWVFVQYFNPYSLGILPSIAGSKVYLSMPLLYFLCYHHLEKEDSRRLLIWITALGLFEATFSVIEYRYFPEVLPRIIPAYDRIAQGRFSGVFYRPIGTTAGCGGPSVWMFLAFPIAAYVLLSKGRGLLAHAAAAAFLPLGAITLLFCQTRSAMVLSVGGFGLVALAAVKSHARMVIATSVGLAIFATLGGLTIADKAISAIDLPADKLEQLQSRIESIENPTSFSTARHGAWGAMKALAEKTISGIGLSRVASAAAPWRDLIDKDPNFGPRWSFSDNLWRALFTELGLFGGLAWAFPMLVFILGGMRAALRAPEGAERLLIWTCAVAPLMWLIGGFGSEGALYAPVSTLSWILFGIGTKEAQLATHR